VREEIMRGVILLAAGLVACASSADAARVSGRVRMVGERPVQASVDPYPAQLGSLPTPQAPASGAQDVALVLEPEGPGVAAPALPNVVMAQKGQAFQPHVLAIPVGTVVEFPNFDPVFHNVFSYSKTKKFDLGRYGRGGSKSVTFDKPGIVKVFCDIHSNMSGFIYVTASPWVTQPGSDGRYSFGDVAPGTYLLETWHPERGQTKRRVVVEDGDLTIDLDL
jgi:plastocyanin